MQKHESLSSIGATPSCTNCASLLDLHLQLLWELDNGRAVGLSGIPDDMLRSQLQFILQHLGLKCTQVRQQQRVGLTAAVDVDCRIFTKQTEDVCEQECQHKMSCMYYGVSIVRIMYRMHAVSYM